MQLNKMTIQRYSCPAWTTLGPLVTEAGGIIASAFCRDALLSEGFTPFLTRHSCINAAFAAAGDLP